MRERILIAYHDTNNHVSKVIEDSTVIFTNTKLYAIRYYISHLQDLGWRLVQEGSMEGGSTYILQHEIFKP